jgi:hypothetical protein
MLCPFPLALSLTGDTVHFCLVLLKFNTSFRIAVVNGIWSAGDFFLTDTNYCTNLFEAHLSAFSLLSVIRGAKSRFHQLVACHLDVFFEQSLQTTRRELERSLAASQEEIARLKSKCVADNY